MDSCNTTISAAERRDVDLVRHGGIVLLTPLTAEAQAWIAENNVSVS